MNITEMRTHIRYFARNAGDSTQYNNTEVDFSGQIAMDEAVQRLKCLPTNSTLSLTSGSDTLPTFPGGFTPDLLISAYLTGSNIQVSFGITDETEQIYIENAPTYTGGRKTAQLKIRDYTGLLDLKYAYGLSGQPTQIAFQTLTAGLCYPKPNDTYVLNLLWNGTINAWTAGSSGSELTTSLYLPDKIMRYVVMYGAPAYLQHNDPDHKYAAVTWQKWQGWLDRNGGINNLKSTDPLIERRTR